MQEHEETSENITFKVTDRRKFNPDGTVKEGVVIEPEKKTQAEVASTATNVKTQTGGKSATDAAAASQTADSADEDLPGGDDPASFVNFLSTLATNAAAALGAVPHPVTGQRTLDLDSGKFWIDVLAMLREKRRGISTKKKRVCSMACWPICGCNMCQWFEQLKRSSRHRQPKSFQTQISLGKNSKTSRNSHKSGKRFRPPSGCVETVLQYRASGMTSRREETTAVNSH